MANIANSASKVGRVDNKTQKKRHLSSTLKAENDISLDATGNINLAATKLIAGNDISLKATGDTSLSSVTDENYTYWKKVKKKSFGRKKTYTRETYNTNNVGSQLIASNDITINTDINDNSISKTDSGKVSIESSLVEAGNELAISADQELELTSKQKIAYYKYTKKKKGFLGLSRSSSGSVNRQLLLSRNELNTKKNDLSLLSGDNITIAASNLKSGKDINIEAEKDLLISAGQEAATNTTMG